MVTDTKNNYTTDCEIQATFRRIWGAKQPIPEHLAKLLKSIKSWHRKTGGLSLKQVELLRNIEKQLSHE